MTEEEKEVWDTFGFPLEIKPGGSVLFSSRNGLPIMGFSINVKNEESGLDKKILDILNGKEVKFNTKNILFHFKDKHLYMIDVHILGIAFHENSSFFMNADFIKKERLIRCLKEYIVERMNIAFNKNLREQ